MSAKKLAPPCAPADPHPFVGEFIWTAQNNDFGWTKRRIREYEQPYGIDITRR